MDNAATKQEREKASYKTKLNADESSLQFTAAISRKSEFVTAYLFGADFLLSCIVVLAEFADYEQLHTIVVAGCFGLHAFLIQRVSRQAAFTSLP